ncbi:MAG: UDP-N-acetylmuramoyl-L-alanine--D-glutamate ligase [Clostridia bacterium]|nr:UDP-N-acetylmuramoyl-L-alanine--D-glutamate ligase [Clostridia bacterium]
MLKEYVKGLVSGKKVLILGFGREGRSTYRLLKEAGGFAEIAVADEKGASDIPERVFSDADYMKAAENYDIVFKSPGVVLGDFAEREKIISQTDVMLGCCRDRIIGITGTKGKSTTTTLIYHVLECCGKNPVLMGNIGIPAFDAAEKIGSDNMIVYELSCHQLEYSFESPHIGVLLNIYPEHLDHYGSFEKYRAAKENIYKNMKKNDFLVCGSDVRPVCCPAEIFTVTLSDDGADCRADGSGAVFNDGRIEFSRYTDALFGVHSMYNISAAYAVCSRLGIGGADFLAALRSFKALSHRLEFFAEIDGVKYFDDSISTIPETAVQALKSIKNAQTLILGGMDRGVSQKPLIDYLLEHPIKRAILMPDTGKAIYDALAGKFTGELYMTDGLAEAARLAKEKTCSGEACVLSPAAASYGFFKNFEERGNAFKKYISGVKNLAEFV